MDNMNEIIIINADGADIKLEDNSIISEDGKTIALYKNIETELIKRINQAEIVIGCIAWLTSKPILEALSKKYGVALVVQKEDFLRPDFKNKSEWKSELRLMYDALPSTLSRSDEGWKGTILGGMSTTGDTTLEAVRCVGNYNREKKLLFRELIINLLSFVKKQQSANTVMQK